MSILNKNTLEYRFIDNIYNEKHIAEELIKEIIVKATPTSSCWWSKLKQRVGGNKSCFEDKVEKMENELNNIPHDEGFATAKTCSGILNLFAKTYLLKSPSDVIISFDSDGACRWEISDPRLISVQKHTRNQFWSEDNTLFENKVCIKLSFMIRIKTNNCGYILSEPSYHNKIDANIPLGYISPIYAKSQELNLFIFIDLPKEGATKSIVIKKGDVVAYLMPDVKSKLVFSAKTFVEDLLVLGFSKKRR